MKMCIRDRGLGGEWGGAVLLATENAPPGKSAWYGMFPQLGAPLGFLCSTGVFLLISTGLSNIQLLSWGWRVPFLASALLVLVGLYIRLQLVETPAFKRSIEQGERVRVPFLAVITQHPRELLLGTLGATTTFVVFYLMTVFALSWATTALKFPRVDYLIVQMIGVLFFGLTIPISAVIADRIGGRMMLIIATLAIMLFGFLFAPLFGEHDIVKVCVFVALGFSPVSYTHLDVYKRQALLGAMPLAFGHGVGSELRRPLGITIVGGLIFSQLLTLYTTPVIYLFFDGLAARFSRGRGRDDPSGTPA